MPGAVIRWKLDKCPLCAANYGLPLTPARCQDDLLVGGGVEGTNTFRFSATAGEGDFPTLADLVARFDGAALDTNNDFGFRGDAA